MCLALILPSVQLRVAGNGVYACSQARALSQLGHEVLVVAGAPPGHDPAASSACGGREGEAPPLAAHIMHVSGMQAGLLTGRAALG